MKAIIRNKERTALKKALDSNQAEFIAVYGRRRVGKTFLIKHFFEKEKCFFFTATGIENGSFDEQRKAFCNEISNTLHNKIAINTPDNWLDIFEMLNNSLSRLPKSQKKVLFLDELPWMNTAKSNLLSALEYFWNQHWSNNKNIKLVICGSLASWIIKNIINNTGGFYKRVTKKLKINALNLTETKKFLKNIGINLNQEQTLSLYMAFGGIPAYLNQFEKGLSADQLIDQLCFQTDSFFLNEVGDIFSSLFKNAKAYLNITKEISTHKYGIDRASLAKNLKLTNNTHFINQLDMLEDAGFISSSLPFEHERKYYHYRISDEFVMFHFQWIEPNRRKIQQQFSLKNLWLDIINAPKYYAWKGYIFETICYKHSEAIKRALNIKTSSLAYIWKHSSKKTVAGRGAQIDLLFDRPDNAITLCEIKCTDQPFVVDKKYSKELLNKINVFEKTTKTNKQLFLAIISTKGLKPSMYSEELISNVVKLDDLFET